MYTEAKNPRYVADGAIQLEVRLEGDETHVTYTARPDDVAPLGVRLFADALSGEFGPVAAYVPPSLEQVRADKLELLAHTRWERETAGITVGGAAVHTDRESQAQLNSAFVSLSSGLIQSTNWKGPSGWVLVTLEELQPVAAAVAQYVAACFASERAHAQTIAGLSSVSAVLSHSVNSGWPSRDFPAA